MGRKSEYSKDLQPLLNVPKHEKNRHKKEGKQKRTLFSLQQQRIVRGFLKAT